MYIVYNYKILADKDTNLILTDDTDRAIPGKKYGNASGVTFWPNFEPMQVAPPGLPRAHRAQIR